MDNFNLRKFLAEGKLYKDNQVNENQGGIMLDGVTMLGGDWDGGMSSEERAFTEKNLIGSIPAQEWLTAFGKYWEMIGEFGGDSDVVEDGLLDHVVDGLLNINEATSVWEMYWDGGQDSEAKERFQDSCVIALVKAKFGKHPEYSGWEQDYRSIGAADFASDFDDNNKILQGAEAYLKDGGVNEGAGASGGMTLEKVAGMLEDMIEREYEQNGAVEDWQTELEGILAQIVKHIDPKGGK